MRQVLQRGSLKGASTRKSVASLAFVGMWADRKDLRDAARWVREQRAGWIGRSSRHGGR